MLEDVGVRNNGAKAQATLEYFHARLETRLKGIYELEDHVGEEALSSNLSLKLGFIKKILHVGFPSCLLENV